MKSTSKLLAVGLVALGSIGTIALMSTSFAAESNITTTANNTTTSTKSGETKGMFGMMGHEKGARGGFGMGARGGFGMGAEQDPAISAALKANDYDAFSKAIIAKNTNAKVPSKDQFTKIAAKFQKHQAIENAINSNNYDSFVTAFNAEQKDNSSSVTKVVPTKEQFAEIVKKSQHRQATKKAIESNDYNAFVAAYNANVPNQTQFDTMVKIDKAIKSNDTATLETLRKSGPMGDGFDDGMRGGKMGFGGMKGGHRGR